MNSNQKMNSIIFLGGGQKCHLSFWGGSKIINIIFLGGVKNGNYHFLGGRTQPPPPKVTFWGGLSPVWRLLYPGAVQVNEKTFYLNRYIYVGNVDKPKIVLQIWYNANYLYIWHKNNFSTAIKPCIKFFNHNTCKHRQNFVQK